MLLRNSIVALISFTNSPRCGSSSRSMARIPPPTAWAACTHRISSSSVTGQFVVTTPRAVLVTPYLLTAPGTHVCCHLLRVHRAKDAFLSLRKRSLPLFFRNESLQQYVPGVMSRYLGDPMFAGAIGSADSALTNHERSNIVLGLGDVFSPCKETAASHSGHCAMIGFSFYLVWIANLVQKFRQIKKPFILQRTKSIHATSVVPPLYADASQRQASSSINIL